MVPPISPAKVPPERCNARTAVSARDLVLLKTMNAVITAQYQREGETASPTPIAIAHASVTWIGAFKYAGMPRVLAPPPAFAGGAGFASTANGDGDAARAASSR